MLHYQAPRAGRMLTDTWRGGGVGEGAQGLVTPRQTWHHHFVLSVMHTTKKRFS